MKTILITGSNGLLGQKLVYNLLNANTQNQYNIIATSKGENRMNTKLGYTYHPLDITAYDEVEKLYQQVTPDVVINTAAMTNVDQCENDKQGCDLLNITAVKNQIQVLENLQETAPNYHPHLIHLSTDFVFDGEAGPYKEDDLPNPISHYGWSKNEGDKLVANSKLKNAIVRTIIVYGVVDNLSRSNIVLWAKGALEKGEKINVINDQYRAPTLAEDLATACLLIAQKEATGYYHISSATTYSILQLVHQIADYWHLDKSYINPISSLSLNQAAKRPPRTGFIIQKAINDLGFKPATFAEGLAIINQQLKAR